MEFKVWVSDEDLRALQGFGIEQTVEQLPAPQRRSIERSEQELKII